MIRIFLTAVLLSACGSAFAQDYNCRDPQFQQEMNYCAAQEFDNADAQLNAGYRKSIAFMKSLDRDLDKEQKGAENALRISQRTWVKYRDQACEAEAYLFHGGTMEPLIYNSCRARLTRQRTDDLRNMAENFQ